MKQTGMTYDALELATAISLGIAVTALVFAALQGGRAERFSRRPVAVGAAAIGFVVTIALLRDSFLLVRVRELVALRGVAVVLVALGAALAFWRSTHRR